MDNNKIHKLLISTPFVAAAIFAVGCDVDQTEQGDMPEVDVDYEEGNLPEYDVEMADVDVGTTTETVSVPKVRVVVEEEEVEVPYVDFEMPNESDEANKVKQTISAKVSAPGSGYDLKIIGAYYNESEIAVISKITETGSSVSRDAGVPISDSIVLNAPESNITHYVIAPEGDFEGLEGDYEFESNRNSLEVSLSNFTQVYNTQR